MRLDTVFHLLTLYAIFLVVYALNNNTNCVLLPAALYFITFLMIFMLQQ